MRYKVDHDYHIHSKISLCSGDPEQTNERILAYAESNGLKRICLTDHFWDEAVKSESIIDFYSVQNYGHIAKALPLPKSKTCEFLFGCETDLDKNYTLGISSERCNSFDFIIIPTTHLHMNGFTIEEKDFSPERRAVLWVKRFEALLNKKLPFNKVGIAHLACPLIASSSREDYLKVLSLIPVAEMHTLFSKAAKIGVGIELNSADMSFTDDEADTVLKMFRIAKTEGCKFYLGSDAHHPQELDKAPAIFERAIDFLNLTEQDKFYIK